MEELSKEKCSSNVVEKSLNRGDEATRDLIITEIVSASDLRSMLLDPVVLAALIHPIVRELRDSKGARAEQRRPERAAEAGDRALREGNRGQQDGETHFSEAARAVRRWARGAFHSNQQQYYQMNVYILG